MRLAIICVAVNCLEYSKQTIESIQTTHDYDIIFVDNGSTDGTKNWLNTRKDIIAIKNPIVTGLAGAWNLAIKKAIDLGCSHFLILNNDLILAKNTIDNLVKKMDSGKYVMVTGVNDMSIPLEDMPKVKKEYDENEPDNEHPDFSCFMINANTIEKIGWFDENIKVAYFEDSEYHARIALLGEKAVSTTSATYYHLCSQTIKNNPNLKPIIEKAFIENKNYFIEKYGCEPLGDVPKMREVYYKFPFNDPNEDLKKPKRREKERVSVW